MHSTKELRPVLVVSEPLQCAEIARYHPQTGRPIEPRRCKHRPKVDSIYCGIHAKLAARTKVTTADGGWCIWCTAPGKRYACSRDPHVTIDLCVSCGEALSRVLFTERDVRLQSKRTKKT